MMKTNNQILIQISSTGKQSAAERLLHENCIDIESVQRQKEYCGIQPLKRENPCSYSNRSATLPQATGKMSMYAWEGLCTYVHAWVAGVCVCVCPWPMGRRLWQACLLKAFFWSLDQRAHHLTATTDWGMHTDTLTHGGVYTCIHTTLLCRRWCTFTHGHNVSVYYRLTLAQAHTHICS